VLGGIVDQLQAQGLPAERIGLLGFSQGACLATEFAARNVRRYGCVLALSGGLIGPPGTPRDYGGSLAGTPVFLGCSDIDPHIPLERVQESAAVLSGMGAEVDERIYPGMGHVVNDDEIAAVRELVRGMAEPPRD
jgi:predicted esterase